MTLDIGEPPGRAASKGRLPPKLAAPQGAIGSALAAGSYLSATIFFTRSSRALPWSPEATTSKFSLST
jgi:hypothetical protein